MTDPLAISAFEGPTRALEASLVWLIRLVTLGEKDVVDEFTY